jgi:hypothetical protein
MSPDEMLKLVENFYEGLSEEDVAEIEKIMLDRSNFFSRNPNRILELIEEISEENLRKAVEFGETFGDKNL